jgi:hypothetical protein
MSKKFDDILSERLEELPSYAPGENIWAGIEDALNAEEAISRKLVDLPRHSPAPGNWEAIEASLPSGLRARRRHRLLYISSAAAAAILILLAIPQLMKPGQDISVESEIIQGEELSTATSINLDDEDPMELIRDICQTGAPVCESASFREKMKLYQELTEELRQLETVISQLGDSPEIIRSVIRIENLKSSTLQEMIQMIHS